MLLSTSGVHEIVLTVFAVMIIIILLGSVYALLSSIFGFVFAGGDPERVKSSYNGIRYMVIGLLFTIVLLFVFPVFFKWMEIPNYELFTIGNIFARVGEILQYLFQFGGMVRDGSDVFDGLNIQSGGGGGGSAPSSNGNYTL